MAMREHAALVAETFAGCGRSQIQSDLLLPTECGESLDQGEHRNVRHVRGLSWSESQDIGWQISDWLLHS